MASDILYIKDIPNQYHYADYSEYYVDLYNQPSARNETLKYYRIYFNVSPGTYIEGTRTFGSYNTTYFDNIEVSNSWWYRNDLDVILVSVLCISLFFIFLFNIFTSIFRKGGLFGGLL